MTAIAHFLFNTTSAIIFLFLIKQLEWVATKLIKGDDKEIVFTTLNINKEPHENFKDNVDDLERELAHFLDIARSMLTTVIAYIDLRERSIFERLVKFAAYSDYLAQSCDSYIHTLSAQYPLNERDLDQLIKMLRMIDFVRQAVASQRQIADIPELIRMPNIEEATRAKAEIFGLFNLIGQIYEHLHAYVISSDRKSELHQIESVNANLTNKINDIYRASITNSLQTAERVTSLSLALLTKAQSIQSKSLF